MKLLALLGAMACACMPAALAAQSTASSVQFPSGWAPGMSPCVQQANGTCLPVSASNPLPVTGGTGGGGGGSTPTGPAGTPNGNVVTVQGISSGTVLPISANALPLPLGAATAAKQDTLVSALGSPFQAGGSIGNTAFAISGTLPAFAATPVFNIGTGGAGTAATPVIVDSLYRGTAVDRGGIFGTTAAQLMAANALRRGFSVQVQGTSGSCYINGAATATADYHSLQIPAGNLYETPDNYSGTGAVSIICTAASTSVYARER